MRIEEWQDGELVAEHESTDSPEVDPVDVPTFAELLAALNALLGGGD